MWVVQPPSPHWHGLGQDSALLPGEQLFRGHWCNRVMTYHFGNHLMVLTTCLIPIDGFVDPARNVRELDRLPEQSSLLGDLQLDLDLLLWKIITEKGKSMIIF